MGKTPTQKELELLDPIRKEYSFKPSRTFYYDENDQSLKFSEYIRKNSDELYFPCPNLRVLPEDVIIIREQGPPDRYHKGDPLCLLREEKDISRRCSITSKVLNREFQRDRVVACAEGYRLSIVVTKVEKI